MRTCACRKLPQMSKTRFISKEKKRKEKTLKMREFITGKLKKRISRGSNLFRTLAHYSKTMTREAVDGMCTTNTNDTKCIPKRVPTVLTRRDNTALKGKYAFIKKPHSNKRNKRLSSNLLKNKNPEAQGW